MKVKIDIETKTIVRVLLVFIGFGLLGLFIYKAWIGLVIILMSAFLAVALNPAVSKLSSVLPGKSRKLATTVAYILIVVVLGTILALMVPQLIEQTAKFIQSMPNVVESTAERWDGFNGFIESNGLTGVVKNVTASIEEFSGNFAKSLAPNILNSAGSVIASITATILVVVLTFLMLIQGPGLLDRFWKSLNKTKKTDKARKIIHNMTREVTNFVNGQLIIALIDGAVTALSIFILSLIFDIPAGLALPLGLFTGLLSLIPMFGVVISGFIVTVMLLFNNFIAAIIFLVFFIIYQQIEANVISPIVQGKSSRLPALIILGSVTIGVYLFGLLGGIIAIPVAGCIRVLVNELLYEERALEKKSASKAQ